MSLIFNVIYIYLDDVSNYFIFADMDIGLWDILAGSAATFATAGAAAFFTRRQAKIEIEKLRQEVKISEQEVKRMEVDRESAIKTAEMEIVERYNKFQAGLMESLKKEITDLREDYDKSRTELRERQEYSDKLRVEIDRLQRTIEHNKKEADREITKLRKELEAVKREFPCADCPRRVNTSRR